MISGAVRQTLLLSFTTSRSQGGGGRCRATCFDVFFLKVRLRGRPLLAEGVTGVWSGTGSLVTGVGFHQDSAWLLLQPTLALGQCGAPVHEHTPTPAVKCTSLATCSNVLQQLRRAWPFSARAPFAVPQRRNADTLEGVFLEKRPRLLILEDRPGLLVLVVPNGCLPSRRQFAAGRV